MLGRRSGRRMANPALESAPERDKKAVDQLPKCPPDANPLVLPSGEVDVIPVDVSLPSCSGGTRKRKDKGVAEAVREETLRHIAASSSIGLNLGRKPEIMPILCGGSASEGVVQVGVENYKEVVDLENDLTFTEGQSSFGFQTDNHMARNAGHSFDNDVAGGSSLRVFLNQNSDCSSLCENLPKEIVDVLNVESGNIEAVCNGLGIPSNDATESVSKRSHRHHSEFSDFPIAKRRRSLRASTFQGLQNSGRRNLQTGSLQNVTELAHHIPIEIDDLESTRNRAFDSSKIDLENELESERAMQVAEDERLARFLQAEYYSESSERTIIRNGRPSELPQRTSRDSRISRIRNDNTSFPSSSIRSSQIHGPDRTSGSSHRRGHLQRRAARSPLGRRFQFPAVMDLDARIEFLAALELAFEEHAPLGLQLTQVDRDFTENDYEMLLALDENNDHHRGAPHEVIERLPITIVQVTDLIEEACSICLEKPVTEDKVRWLPCMHSFHKQCIDSWLIMQGNCPVCKLSI